MSREVSSLFAGISAAPAPADLKERAVRAGRQAMVAAPRPGIWRVLWTSTAVRVAWAICIAGLAAAHLLLPMHHAARPAQFSMPVLVAGGHGNGELDEVTDLARISRDLPHLVGRTEGPRQPEETQS